MVAVAKKDCQDDPDMASCLPVIKTGEVVMLRAGFTPEKLRELLDYDPETGVFVWRVRQSRAVPAGTEAGSVKSNGRRYINVCNGAHLAHRLAWFYVHGVWPSAYVRVRDGDYTNCRLSNLFESTVTESNNERRLGKNNTSGRVGVTFNARKRKWKALIKRDWKMVHLGYFDTFEEACAARAQAEETFVSNIEPHSFERERHHERIRQRQRTAWRLLSEKFAGQIVWQSLTEFAADVGEPPDARYTVVPIDSAQPVGPTNYQWLAPPSERFDMKTSAGRNARKREYHQETNESQWLYGLRSRYDLTEEEVRALLDLQDHRCGICRLPESSAGPNGGDEPRRLSVDHDHRTGKPRGFLCNNCNNGMGKFGDSILMLRAAIAFLEEPPADIILRKRERDPLPRKESA